MSQPIKVNDSLFLAIESFYSNQQLALSGIENYLQQNCALGDAFGLLLGGLKPQYDEGREKATSVVRAIEKSIGALRSNVVDYQHDVEEQEKAVQAQTDALRKQADDIAAAAAAAAAATATASSVSSGGGYRTPGGGGGRATYSGPSGSVTPPVTAVAPSASVVPVAPLAPVTPAASGVTTTINAGEGSTVTVIDGNGNVVAHHNAGTPDPTTTPTPTPIPTPTTAAPGTSTHAGPATPDPTSIAPPATASATPLDPAALAAQNAHHAALYDQLWKDQAAVDPLGRSASELRLAWEARESVALDPASVGGTAIGFGAAADPLVTIPVNFSPMAFDPVTPAITQPPILAGAFA